MMTGGATVLVVALLIGVLVGTEKGHRARIAAWITTLLLVNEAFLGYLLVTLGYVTTNRSFGRVVVLSIHLSNTMLLLAALTVTAALLERGEAQPQITTSLKTLWWAAAGLAADDGGGRERIAGRAGRYTLPFGDAGCIVCAGLFSRSAFAVARALGASGGGDRGGGICGVACFKRRRGRLRWLVAGLLGVQFLLGVADVLLLAPVVDADPAPLRSGPVLDRAGPAVGGTGVRD